MRFALLLVGSMLFAFSSEAADSPWWWADGTMTIVGGKLPDGGAGPISLDSSGNVKTVTSIPTCDAVVIHALSCGTTPAAFPVSRTGGSTSLEITNSPENAGTPKVKCIVDPADGGVGFGGTNPGLVRVPGESMFFALNSNHTVICVCDTPGTAVVTSECAP